MKALIASLCLFLVILQVTILLHLDILSSVIFFLTTILLFQGAFASYAMLYSFLKNIRLKEINPPRLIYGKPERSFSLIIPARHEKKVIADTIYSCAKINYPQNLFEVIVVVREDDDETIAAAQDAIDKIKSKNIKLITFNGFPINKSRGLNEGLKSAKLQIIGVFDAEDEIRPNILRTIDTTFSNTNADAIQASIQLITMSSNWYSALNCLEYYFWFKSVLPFFSKIGSTPLGGNTVFFKKSILDKINGWDERILTEDADIGLRLSSQGYKIASFYDEKLTTLEETPADLPSFIRQRTRWNQGYLQVLFKGEWLKLPQFKQQILTLYLLLQPVVHHFGILGFIILPFFARGAGVPLWLALYSFFPLYFLVLQIGVCLAGIKDLKKYYGLRTDKSVYLWTVLSYFSYQLVLSYSSLRAFTRIILGFFSWEKTTHINFHRKMMTDYQKV